MVAFYGVAAVAFLFTLQPALALVPGTSANNIFARQLGSLNPNAIPSSCLTSSCQSLATVLQNNCTTLRCLCTTAVYNGLKSCLQCAVTAGTSGYTQSQVDSALNQFSNSCTSGGFPISGASTSGGSTSGSSGGLGGSSSGLGSTPSTTTGGLGGLGGGANTATTAAPAATTAAGGLPLSGLNAASKSNVGIFGVMFTVVLGAIALL